MPRSPDELRAALENKRTQRLLVMRTIYDLTDGASAFVVSVQDIAEAAALVDAESLPDVVEHLQGEGLIEVVGTRIRIAHKGRVEFESALTNPAQATEHFPPYYVISGSQHVTIQNASPGATQIVAVTPDEAGHIAEILALVRAAVDASTIPAADRAELLSEVDAAQAEIETGHADPTSLRTRLSSIAHRLVGGIGFVADAAAVADLLHKLHTALPLI